MWQWSIHDTSLMYRYNEVVIFHNESEECKMKLSKVIRKKKEEIRWLLSKNKITDVLLWLANDRSPGIVKYYKLNANWLTKCATYCMRKWLFIFRGIWNPIEASFAMLCYVPVGTRMSITVHACVHVHVWQLPAQPPGWMSAGWWTVK